jgi:hypothetical protein
MWNSTSNQGLRLSMALYVYMWLKHLWGNGSREKLEVPSLLFGLPWGFVHSLKKNTSQTRNSNIFFFPFCNKHLYYKLMVKYTTSSGKARLISYLRNINFLNLSVFQMSWPSEESLGQPIRFDTDLTGVYISIAHLLGKR